MGLPLKAIQKPRLVQNAAAQLLASTKCTNYTQVKIQNSNVTYQSTANTSIVARYLFLKSQALSETML